MSKFIVSKEIEFDAGHRVPLHSSKCRNPHGHRYKVVANVAGELWVSGSSTGMVMDFGDIKRYLTELVHDVYDHGFIVQRSDDAMLTGLAMHEWEPYDGSNWKSDLGWKVIIVDWTPTAEEMARAIYEDLRRVVAGLVSVDVYETPTSKASYPWGE